MANLYKKFPENLPPDFTPLFVDRSAYIGEPFEATYNHSAQQFTSIDNSIIYPAYVIVRWRYV